MGLEGLDIFTIVAIIKKEQLYIQEWLDYHIALGVDRFMLFDNDGEHIPYNINIPDGIRVEIEPFTGHKASQAQMLAYDIACSRLAGETAAFIDIDEYITINEGFAKELSHDGKPDILSVFNHFSKPAIALCWETYGANGHIKRPEGKIVDVYSEPSVCQRDKGVVKCILKAEKNMHWTNPHIPHDVTVFDTNGNELKNISGKPLYDKVYIRHYITKSWDDWIIRMKRGHFVEGFRPLNSFFTYNPDMLPLFDELTAGLQSGEFKTTQRDSVETRIKNKLLIRARAALNVVRAAQVLMEFFEDNKGVYKTEEKCRQKIASLLNSPYKSHQDIIDIVKRGM